MRPRTTGGVGPKATGAGSMMELEESAKRMLWDPAARWFANKHHLGGKFGAEGAQRPQVQRIRAREKECLESSVTYNHSGEEGILKSVSERLRPAQRSRRILAARSERASRPDKTARRDSEKERQPDSTRADKFNSICFRPNILMWLG